ncbi:MAG: hypothetical protein JNK10_14945 [Cyclobacteriaceae bacterium]|nr:hypothetical protein [Cyclobacteriaceae bacterium]
MSEKYKFVDPEGLYFTTTTTVGWIDVFTRPELKRIVIQSLRHCQKEKGLVYSCLVSDAKSSAYDSENGTRAANVDHERF